MSIERYLLANLLMDFSLLTLAARCCRVFRPGRALAAAGLGAGYALLAALCPRPWASPLALAGLLVPTSMLAAGRGALWRAPALAAMLAAGTLLAGGIGGLARRLAPANAPVAPFAAAGLALAALLLGTRQRLRATWRVEIGLRSGGRETRFSALIDTGNRLREPLSGLPVLIAEARLLEGLLPESGYRAVAYGGVGGGGTLRCFRPDALWIEAGPRRRPAQAWVGVLPGRLPGDARALAPGEFALVPSRNTFT